MDFIFASAPSRLKRHGQPCAPVPIPVCVPLPVAVWSKLHTFETATSVGLLTDHVCSGSWTLTVTEISALEVDVGR
jgi:hypothetical protein